MIDKYLENVYTLLKTISAQLEILIAAQATAPLTPKQVAAPPAPPAAATVVAALPPAIPVGNPPPAERKPWTREQIGAALIALAGAGGINVLGAKKILSETSGVDLAIVKISDVPATNYPKLEALLRTALGLGPNDPPPADVPAV